MAANDSNKLHIVDCGALPYYVKIMHSGQTAVEQAEAAHGIWTLAFNQKCKERILKEDGCIEGTLTLKCLFIRLWTVAYRKRYIGVLLAYSMLRQCEQVNGHNANISN